MAATRGDAPEWFEPPADVVRVEICPLSGKVAAGGCPDRARRFFARGTQPIEYCDVHGPGLFRQFVGLIAGQRPTAVEDEASPDPSDHVSAPPALPEPAADPDTVVKKRGFWSRLFHRGADR